MKKKKKLVALFLLSLLGLALGFRQYQSYQEISRLKEAMTLLNSKRVAIRATEAELGKLPTSLDVAGFNPSGKLHYKVHGSPDSLTQKELQGLPENFIPYMNEKSFRLLTTPIQQKPTDNHFCKIELLGEVECIVK